MSLALPPCEDGDDEVAEAVFDGETAVSALSFAAPTAKAAPRRNRDVVAAGGEGDSDDEAVDVATALRGKGLDINMLGVVVAHKDTTRKGGVPQHKLLMAHGTFVVDVMSWRDLAEDLHAVVDTYLGAYILAKHLKFKPYKGKAQFEFRQNGSVEHQGTLAVPSYTFPWGRLSDIVKQDDYSDVHLKLTVGYDSKGRVPQEGAGLRGRKEVRLYNSEGEYIDMVLWGANASLPMPRGASISIFFGSLNRERQCIDIDDATHSAIVQVDASVDICRTPKLKPLSWTPFSRKRKAE